jgi:hypothetical protein
MIKRQYVVPEFFDEAGAMRELLDQSFKDAYKQRIRWQYFCDPGKYTYLRTTPNDAFQAPIFERFLHRLSSWCVENLGLVPMNLPYLHLMINGCKLGFHSDFHNGAWGYVYSLTRWNTRRFSGGETLLLRDGIPSYKKHHVDGDALYELFPAYFNQLLIFDDRIVHSTPSIEGNMDPLDGRIAMVGHIRATSPIVYGRLRPSEVGRVFIETMTHLRDRIRTYKDVQGTITFRITVSNSGTVDSVMVLTDNLVSPAAGYEPTESVTAVKSMIQQTIHAMRFPSNPERSSITLPILIPIPDLRPIEVVVPHNTSRKTIYDWAQIHLGDSDNVELKGEWDEETTFIVTNPISGTIRIEPRHIVATFDPPMWVPSQRGGFQSFLMEWARNASTADKQ